MADGGKATRAVAETRATKVEAAAAGGAGRAMTKTQRATMSKITAAARAGGTKGVKVASKKRRG